MNSAGVNTTPLARALAVSATMRSAPVPARIAPASGRGRGRRAPSPRTARPDRGGAPPAARGSWSRSVPARRPPGGQREDRGPRVGGRLGEVAPRDRHGGGDSALVESVQHAGVKDGELAPPESTKAACGGAGVVPGRPTWPRSRG